MFQVLDLFSGIGGFSLGLERTGGFATVAFCEREGYACRVLRKHWPTVPIFEDVRTLTKTRLRHHGLHPDFICGGFPCQDLSTAGKGSGLDGARSGLWTELHRLIREIRPAYALVENVAALRSRGLDRVLGDLAAIGYDAEWHCIPAAALGAPHRRDRVWIVAYPHRDVLDQLRQLRPEQSPLGIHQHVRPVPQRPGLWPDWPGEEPFPGAPQSRVCRMGDGFPHLVDRGRGLGNAVCPPVVEALGRAILDHHRSRSVAATAAVRVA